MQQQVQQEGEGEYEGASDYPQRERMLDEAAGPSIPTLGVAAAAGGERAMQVGSVGIWRADVVVSLTLRETLSSANRLGTVCYIRGLTSVTCRLLGQG